MYANTIDAAVGGTRLSIVAASKTEVSGLRIWHYRVRHRLGVGNRHLRSRVRALFCSWISPGTSPDHHAYQESKVHPTKHVGLVALSIALSKRKLLRGGEVRGSPRNPV
jgi:hypothetical protein